LTRRKPLAVRLQGGGIEQALTLKAEEVFGQVVDEVDGAEDGFVAAKAEPE